MLKSYRIDYYDEYIDKPEYQTDRRLNVPDKPEGNQFRPRRQRLSSKLKIPSKVFISFKDLSYQVKCKENGSQTKQILKGVSGHFKPGQITAIMGSSGAGKSTFLNLLACRMPPTSGKLMANGKKYCSDNFPNFAAYVMQRDIFVETLTVRETLKFSADLRLNNSEHQKELIVQEIVRKLQLERCIDTLIGGYLLKGISGGEKRRVSIGFELVSDPDVLMLDQPTSGLDSLTSFIIINHLSQLAKQKGMTVIMTIHQPSYEIFQKFHNLVLFSQGQFVYQGLASEAMQYFQDNFNMCCPTYFNPAQFLQNNLHQFQNDSQDLSRALKTYKSVKSQKIIIEGDNALNSIKDGKSLNAKNFSLSFFSTLAVIIKRNVKQSTRNPLFIKSLILEVVVVGIFVGGLFFNAGQSSFVTNSGWDTIKGLTYFIGLAGIMSLQLPTIVFSVQERQVFFKEESADLYSCICYFFAKIFINIPFILIVPLFFLTLVGFMTGILYNPTVALQLYILAALAVLFGVALGLIIGTAAKNVGIAVSLNSLAIVNFCLFSGLFKNRANYPSWITWVQYINPMKYLVNGFLQAITKDKESFISRLNLNLTYWQSVIGLAAVASLYFFLAFMVLYLKRGKLQ